MKNNEDEKDSCQDQKSMKYVICVPDGCADLPVPELDGRTPLEVANMPNLDSLAAKSILGRAEVIPSGMPPGSDVGNMSIFGYDPSQYHTGRAPIEVAALGIKLRPDQTAFRCNFVKVVDGVMIDYAGGNPSSDEAEKVIAQLNRELGNPDEGISFLPGVSFRNAMIAPMDFVDAVCVPPHDLTGDPVVLPSGRSGQKISDLMAASEEILAASNLEATGIWLWGQGTQPQLPSFSEVNGVNAGLVTAVDLVRGIGKLAEMKVCDIPGATGWYDTDYEGKRDMALRELEGGLDLFIIHVEATDEAGHAGNVEAKVESLENWDSRILKGLISGLEDLGPWRMLMLPDHATPLTLRTHTPDPVPYLLFDSEKDSDGGVFTEIGVSEMPLTQGYQLMKALLAN
ncbi:MAG: 2,3-bisphosphoglycerate-independent phosphoglycerate mutase [Acidimicrobiales bacterium]|jgi:2,3-bisphosphoglycerate-independent phosphoglycerate mutase|nr:phosphoglycerate mutase [Acidimicrobiaceae bacterium]MDP6161725.1 2,3-bisphosphoglycerate-independent phosphoglycerate mutase [Acidimicrobiales bacterium]MDP6285060.1 2,3-bisphosphoglycerate-independent phosphoglycerate mutase [Acidimicrobiales bacterium]HJL91644.1 2,3-bisphosphoglycerate-independent phosphoglycerate mutase [Acidimicrobiales bacterium]HJO40540.1 2,3-bisphosphoglycerate-independent phosphoglycerate mutase [Acidimicrobiales bacterium]|tara:strand:- start:544 stop:1740 length:1197 start_codon:yes stop_codon:yes gene_type:complete